MDLNHLTPVLLGLITGTILGLTGAGGAIIAVPLLTFGLSLTLAAAAPIALLAVTIAASLGAYMGFRQGILRYKAATVMSIVGVSLSPVGLWTAQQIPNRPLSFLFSFVLISVAANIFLQSRQELKGTPSGKTQGQPCMLDQTRGKLTWTLACFRAMVAAGGLAGFLSGLLGVGGGFVIVPALKRFTDLPANAIICTSLGVVTLVSLAGVSLSAATGTINWSLAIPFALGTITGMLIARRLGEKIRGPRLQQLFAVFAFAVGLSMMLKAAL